MKISGCVITKNEESNIAKCINSLKNVADEIVLVDTGSEDNTIQIAKELGASVYSHTWENDFSKARNKALEHATGDWIIFLDADEYFSEDSIPKVRLVIQNVDSNQNIEGIQCELININPDNNKLLDSSHVLRIFRNKEHFRYINKIHEEICNRGKTLKYIDCNNTLSILHTGYSSATRISKAKRNLEMLLSNTEHKTSLYYLATTYFILKDFENAYKYAELALKENSIKECDFLAYKLHFIKIIITMTLESSNKTKIEKLIREANRKYSNHPEIAKIEATYYFMDRRYRKALEKFRHAFECHEKYGSTLVQNNFGGIIHEAYNVIAQIFYFMNKDADALTYYVKALHSYKYFAFAFKGMFALCRALPNNELIALINSIYDVGNEEDVKFIVAQVSDSGIPKIVLYYADKWNNVFAHEDDVLIYAFLAQGNYHKSLEIALLYLKNDKDLYSPLVTSILILGRLFTEAEKMACELSSNYYELVTCYADHRKYNGDTEAFISVFSRLIKYKDQFDITDYLRMGSETDTDLQGKIADVYLADLNFTTAIDYYTIQYDLLDEGNRKASAAFQIGYCFYKLKQYQESIKWFEKSIEKGYANNDMLEYLDWIAEQASDSAIKSKTEELILSYNGRKRH